MSANDLETPLLQSHVPTAKLLFRGKVRDVYQADEKRLALVATDRISAFDSVFPNGIPGKGRALTAVAVFWFRFFDRITSGGEGPGGFRPASPPPVGFDIHFESDEIANFPAAFASEPAVAAQLRGRTMLVRRTSPLPYEFIVRGHLDGSAWAEYQQSGTVWGEALPKGMKRYDPLPALQFTPTSKAKAGHDLPVTWDEFVSDLGAERAARLRDLSIWIYQTAHDFLNTRGIVLEDTKFEFGEIPGSDRPVLIDEALTPDSSRFLLRDAEGRPAPFDKQYIRDAVKAAGWDGSPPAPPLTESVVAESTRRYSIIAERITGQKL